MPTDLFDTRFVDCYVVWGCTGEYSDRREWSIAVFLLESDAKELVRRMDAKVEELGLNLMSYEDDEDDKRLKQFNDHFGFEVVSDIQYTGVRFGYSKTIFGGVDNVDLR